MFLQLFKNKKFLPLLTSRFLSAVNEGFIRTVFLFFVTYKLTQPNPTFMVLAVMLYALSFCFATIYIGQIADKFSKAKCLRIVRLIEIGIMLLALISLSLDSRLLLMSILIVVGMTNACLRVLDTSLITELIAPAKLNTGNTLMKIGVIFASGLSCLLLTSILKFDVAYFVVCSLGLALSIISYFITLKVPVSEPTDKDSIIYRNPYKAFGFVSEKLKHQFDVWAYLVGIAWFWMVSAVIFVFSADYGRTVLNARWSVVMFLSSGLFTVGYMVGGAFYARLSRKNNMGAYTSIVGLLMSLFLFNFIFASMGASGLVFEKGITVFKMLTTNFNYWCIMIDVFALGALAAFFVIPFYTLIQLKTPAYMMGRMMAFSNMVNAIAVLATLIVAFGLTILSLNILQILTLFAVANLFVAVYMIRLLPVQSRRNVFKTILRTLFKVEVNGLENLEKAGNRALLITNHTSYMDVLLISTFIDKRITFAVSDQLIEKTLVKFMTNLMDVHPLDPQSPFAVKYMAERLNEDKLCMILTEGIIEGGNTRMKIYEGPAMMAVKGNAPVLPIRIDGASNTFFSRILGKKAHFKLFPKITINIAEPVDFKFKEELTTREVREKSSSRLYNILSQMTFESYDKNRTLFDAVADSMHMVGYLKPILEDTSRKPVKFCGFFLKSIILGRLIQRATTDEKYVGLMIPTSNACALSVFGLHAFGKIPAMINFTSGPKQVISTCETIGLKSIVTARKVVSMAKLDNLITAIETAGIRVIYLEDLKPTLTLKDKLIGIAGAICPKTIYRKMNPLKPTAEDTAVVLFTSGSEGMPKAVFLSHRNIISNCYQVPALFDVYPSDVFLNCLPMFHSFGLGAGMVLPLLLGVKTVLYPTPLHYRIIPEICASVKATIFFGTDTFLAGYAKCANPYDFNSLRIVVSGAEKVKDETRKIWAEKFGVRLLEGYGATECSPFISVNTFLHSKKDSVGRLMPGISYQLKPVEGITEGQELWVKGPNIMQGYMRHTDPMHLDPPEDGWYDTGDIVSIDENGYISIKGRCKRFAKIGGEMVSLLAVEVVVEKRYPGFVSGAVNIPDAKKGEQIVLITTCKDVTRDDLVTAFKAAGITELGLPSKIIITDHPPLLGTGKFDYVSAKEMAIQEVSK